MSTTRRSKWHAPPPPTPKILHLPLSIALHSSRTSKSLPKQIASRSNLLSLFDQDGPSSDYAGKINEKRWKVSNNILRKERDLLRLERDAALQKLKKSRERKKIDGSDIIEKKMGELKVRSKVKEDEEDGPDSANHKEENVEILKKKMEGLSKGMMERMEEYLQSANRRRQRIHVTEMNKVKPTRATTSRCCCCSCKEVLGRIAEQVKAESEQWSELQKMLDQVKLEMEDLKSSRDIWQRRAVASDLNFRALHPHMVEWKRRAEASEQKVIELQKHAVQLENWRAEAIITDNFPNQMRLRKIKCQQREQGSPDHSTVVEKEKHVLACRLSNNNKSRRSPLREIGNLY